MSWRIYGLVFLLTLISGPSARAQAQQAAKEPTAGDLMIDKYLAAETDKLSKKFLDGAQTLDEWQMKRPRLYREYMDMLGLWPVPEKTPLRVTFTGTIEAPDFTIDKLHFQSKPGLYVTANLYRPLASRGRKPPVGGPPDGRYPAVLYVCGHSNQGRDGNKSAYQDHGIWFARNGYICLTLDSLQLGEIPGVHHGTYGRPWNHLKAYGIDGKNNVENRWWWHATGYTPAGVECWNGIRAIDYLLSRPDVDPERMAVTGISGGGAATFWIAAADERAKCAVPVSGMSDLESYVKNKVINGHCDCMFLYNTYQWDWTTIAAMVAPRPLLFANSDNDPIFPMDANRRIIAKLRKIYTMYGKPELVDEYVSKGGHAYRPDLRSAVFKWINKHVKGDTSTTVNDVDTCIVPGKMLRVFPNDSTIPLDAINGKIDEAFIQKGRAKLPKPGEFHEWKKQLLRKLWPQSWNNDSYLGSSSKLSLRSAPKNLIGVVVTNPNDMLAGFGGYVVCDPRGAARPWTTKSPPNYVERAHVLLGRTVDAGRVFDITSLCRSQKQDVQVVGRGQAGILAAYAALFEPSIKEVVIIDPPNSHKDGPYFLNVLRVLDIPEALGLLAPNVKLTLINARDPAFDRTAEIYRIAGAADKFTRK